MKKIKKWLILLVFMVIAGFIVCACFLENTEKYQYLNSIDYHVEMQQDGSMRVTETWDIDIKNTNTLFKTFTLNKYKYGDITDVKVVDLQQGKELKQIYEEMYLKIAIMPFHLVVLSLKLHGVLVWTERKATANSKFRIL